MRIRGPILFLRSGIEGAASVVGQLVLLDLDGHAVVLLLLVAFVDLVVLGVFLLFQDVLQFVLRAGFQTLLFLKK